MLDNIPDYVMLWDDMIERSSAQKRTGRDNSPSFWDDPVNVDNFVNRLQYNDRTRIELRLASMHIPKESSVLDIGSGPGTLAVPLAQLDCEVTVVEPSHLMVNAMEKYRTLVGARPIRVIEKDWESAKPEEIGTHQYVIASLSLMMGNIRESLLKMDAAATREVHLFWFLVPPSFSRGNCDLWPLLHGEPYCYEPTADMLWNVLLQLGIHANLIVETKKNGSHYRGIDEVKVDYYTRLHAKTDEQKEIVNTYLEERLIKTEHGYIMPGNAKTAHIWWEK
jgi:SAM-dependent methyltransferase